MTDIILLCGGITKGMKSYGPRATIPIGKKKTPLIIDQILKIKQNKTRHNIHAIVGFEHKKIVSIIEDYKIKNINLVYDEQYEHHNSAGALLSVIENINNKFIVFEDGVISSEIPSTNTSYLPLLDKPHTQFNIGTTITDTKIEYLFYDLPNLWAEFFSVSSGDLKQVKELLISNRLKIKKMFLFEMINFLIDNDISFENHKIKAKNVQKIINHKNER